MARPQRRGDNGAATGGSDNGADNGAETTARRTLCADMRRQHELLGGARRCTGTRRKAFEATQECGSRMLQGGGRRGTAAASCVYDEHRATHAPMLENDLLNTAFGSKK